MQIEREMMRGAGPVAVMKLLERGEMYGYEIVQALDGRTDGLLAMGQSTLYPMLYNLEAKGYVTSREKTADSGRMRRYYSLTGKGKRRLADDTAQWKALVKAMTALGVTQPDAQLPGAGA